MAITLVRAIIIYISITIAVRVMGKRQVGELNPQELVVTILISAVATIPLEDNGMPLANSLVPIAIFIMLELFNSAFSMKSLWFRNLVQGKPIFIIKDGKIQQQQMKKLRFTVDDLVDSIRQAGVFDLEQVENAIVETNGTLSVQQKEDKNGVPITVIMDGEIVEEYFGNSHFDENEIRLLAISNGEQPQNIMMMSISKDGQAYIVRKEEK